VIADPAPNTISRPYRGLSVQDVDIPLTPAAIEALLRRREIYRRTAFLALRSKGETALVAVRPQDPSPLFSPVAELRVLSGPASTVWIDEPDADVGNASSLAAAALPHTRDDALAYLVRGRFEHVNFIWRPVPVTIAVTEVIPPHPPKLLAMAEQVIGYDEDLPPIELVLDAVDVQKLMAARPAEHYLLPCRGSGVPHRGEVSFLDSHPPYHPGWLLIGCERSREFHQHFYGERPQCLELCPTARAASPTAAFVLAKCCMLERGVRVDGRTAVVPWGANLDEVRAALRTICGVPAAMPPAPRTAAGTDTALSGETRPPAVTAAPAAGS
jgi:hypothetical protein